MRKRLAVLSSILLILGGVASVSSPFGIGDIIIRKPIVLLQDAASLVVRTLFRSEVAASPTPPPSPVVAGASGNIEPQTAVEVSATKTKAVTFGRLGSRRLEGDGPDQAGVQDGVQDQDGGQGQSGRQGSDPGQSGALVMAAGREDSGGDSAGGDQDQAAGQSQGTSQGSADQSQTGQGNDNPSAGGPNATEPPQAGARGPDGGQGGSSGGNNGGGKGGDGHGGGKRK